MQRTAWEHHGPASFGPPGPLPGLPVLPELADRFAAAAGEARAEPAGGGEPVLEAACGYWSRRGLATDPFHVAAAPGAQSLLVVVLTVVGGDVLLTRPCSAWYAPQVRLLGRPAYHAPTPAECGGVPDPVALLETVRRVRGEGGDPRVLVLSLADDPSGTVPPPELMHEVCEAAVGVGLLVVCDETYRDTLHDPHNTVLISPAEMLPEHVVVVADLGAALVPPGWPAAVARFPGTRRGAELRAAAVDTLAALRSVLTGPVAAVAAHALTEPEAVTARCHAAARVLGVLGHAAYDAVTAAGALCRPPRAGSHLYADLDPLRPALADLGISDSVELEEHLALRLGRQVSGAHRFGEAPDALHVRLSTSPLLGVTDEQRLAALDTADPLELPHVAGALSQFGATFADLTRGSGKDPDADG
jgi:aspartate/methionine/tyrosine aminotransferase